MQRLPTHRFRSTSRTKVATDSKARPGFLPLLRQRQRPVVEQPWFERQLLVSQSQLADERQEPELQLGRGQPAEQQQQVQRLFSQGCAALIY